MKTIYPGLNVAAVLKGLVKGRRTRDYVEHRCSRCRARLMVFSKFEVLTENPEPGKHGGRILLSTRNAADPDNRIAWCVTCNDFVHVDRYTEADVIELLLKRRGVIVRPPEMKKKRSKKKPRLRAVG